MKQVLFAFMLLASLQSNAQKYDTTSWGSLYGRDTLRFNEVLGGRIDTTYLTHKGPFSITLMSFGTIGKSDTVLVMMMVSDTAVGKERNIIFNGSPQTYSNKVISFITNDGTRFTSTAPSQMYPVLILGYMVTNNQDWEVKYLTSEKKEIPDRFIIWQSVPLKN